MGFYTGAALCYIWHGANRSTAECGNLFAHLVRSWLRLPTVIDAEKKRCCRQAYGVQGSEDIGRVKGQLQ